MRVVNRLKNRLLAFRADWRELIRQPESEKRVVKPLAITFDITDKCCLKCGTCSKWGQEAAKPELNTEEWKNIILKLKKWLAQYSFSVSGGEPFMRKDLLEIAGFAAENDIGVWVTTNGYLIDQKRAEAIAKSGIVTLAVSLNGVKAETHDYTRGVRGSHEKAIRAIKCLNETRDKMRLDISAILMGYNQNEVVDLVRWVHDNNVDGIGFQALDNASSFYSWGNPDSVSHNNRNWFLTNEFWPKDANRMCEVIDEIIRLKRQGYRIYNLYEQLEWMKRYFDSPEGVLEIECKVGMSNFSVDPYGNVRLCFNMEPIGNMLRSDPQAIWTSGNAKRQRKKIKQCRQTCRLLNCNFRG